MSKINWFVLIVGLCISPGFDRSDTGFAQDLTADRVVAEHLKSIGSPAVLSGIKSRAFVGTTSANFIQGGNGSMTGTSMFVSEGRKLGIVLKYGDVNYPGEYFAFDGKDVSVGEISPGRRSPLADFLFRYNGLVKEGLVGGALAGSWPLLNLRERQADLKYRNATVDGRRMYEIEYRPKQGSKDVKINLFFDPDTFHHVRTEYRVRIQDDMSASQGGSSATGQQPSRTEVIQSGGRAQSSTGNFVLREGVSDSIYELVEKFDDFKKVGEMVLPQSYTIEYSVEGQGSTFIAKWDLKAAQWDFNKTYDDRIFKAQK
jgi:hypothetical protein